MKIYLNLGGESHVVAYKLGADFIEVKFDEKPDVFRYSYSGAGKEHVERMKRFAVYGRWLNHYIRYFVLDLFDK